MRVSLTNTPYDPRRMCAFYALSTALFYNCPASVCVLVNNCTFYCFIRRARSLKCAARRCESRAHVFFVPRSILSLDSRRDLRLKFVATAWKSVRDAKSGRSQSIRFFLTPEPLQDKEISTEQKAFLQQSKSVKSKTVAEKPQFLIIWFCQFQTTFTSSIAAQQYKSPPHTPFKRVLPINESHVWLFPRLSSI